MGRRYRRRRDTRILALAVLVLIIVIVNYWEYVLLIGIGIGVVAVIVYFLRRKKQADDSCEDPIQSAPAKSSPVSKSAAADIPSYSSKGAIMSDCEKEYFTVIRQLVEPQYTVQPQINLASIVSKESHSKYRSELFRNIDFGIFDKEYNIKVLVEINDKTHIQADRIQRDKKVNQICAEAGIPLITFWTKYGINSDYIKDRLSEHLDFNNNAPTPSVDIRDNSDYMPKDFL